MGQSLFRRTFTLKNGRRLVLTLVVMAGAVILAKGWWDSRVFAGYDPGLALEAKVTAEGDLEGFAVERVEINGLVGERIPIRLIRPHGKSGEKVPCVIFLYGIGQNVRFFDRVAPIFAKAGFAMAMPEQFQCGERRKRGIGLIREALALRERSSRLVPETRRLVDLLSETPGIDPRRIDLIGVSYGGIAGCAVVALEPRLRSAVLVMAGGDLPRLLDSLVRKRKPESRFLAPAAASLVAWLLQPFEPLNYIGETSPRSLLFLDVENDEMIDPACTAALYGAAGQPKEKRLYGGRHNSISEDTVRRMLGDALGWLQASQSQGMKN